MMAPFRLLLNVRTRVFQESRRRCQWKTSTDSSKSSKLFLVAGGAGIGALMCGLALHQSSNSPLLDEGGVEAVPVVEVSANGSSKTSVSSTVVVNNLAEKKEKARALCERWKTEVSTPGLSVAVCVQGKMVYTEGFGFADVENLVSMKPETVGRVASISKSMTSVIFGRLIESGDLDIDKPIQTYVPEFPEKTFGGKSVTITARQLVSHIGGVRHYSRVLDFPPDKENAKNVSENSGKTETQQIKDEFALTEYYSREEYKTVSEALNIFKNDDLLLEPGKGFLYTTHGYTLLSAVLEGAAHGTPFAEQVQDLFRLLDLQQTSLDEWTPIVPNRCRYYHLNDKHRLSNSPFVNNSNKWAGGGIQSSVLDLCKFGQALVDAYKDRGCAVLKKETLALLWSPAWTVPRNLTDKKRPVDLCYGMGWFVPCDQKVFQESRLERSKERSAVFAIHAGGAIGASSSLLIAPDEEVSIALIANLQAVGLNNCAIKLLEIFLDDN